MSYRIDTVQLPDTFKNMSAIKLGILREDIMEYISTEVVIAVIVVIFTSVCMFAACCCICCRKTARPHRLTPRPQTAPRKTGWDISPNLQFLPIGVNFNEWRMPKAAWGPGEPGVILGGIGDLDINPNDWKRATDAVDAVLEMLLQEIKSAARRDFPNLRIGNFVRQGSSREGLKVSQADEFDALLLFNIEGLNFKVNHLKDGDNKVLPEFGQLIVEGLTEFEYQFRYQTLDKNGVFFFNRKINKVCLDSRNLHEKVFKSIIVKAANAVETRVNRRETYQQFGFAIQKFSINPPSVNIQINLVEKDGYYDYSGHLRSCMRNESVVLQAATVETVIDVDIVPGLELGRDVVPDPKDWNKTMKCPRYAVFKWFTDNQPSAALYDSPPNILWRMCTSGYEKHVLDVTRGSKEQSYIVTALRIMKLEFRQRKADIWYRQPPQVVTVLRSYHLKHIAFYCILYLTIMNKMKLSGVREALAYFLEFLGVCLEERRLPHFFQANALLVYMFPDYTFNDQSLRYDLLSGKSSDALRQAGLSFIDLKCDLERQYCKGFCTYMYKEFSDAFRDFVKNGKYYC